jgi:uncharacterized protein with HEPN domain
MTQQRDSDVLLGDIVLYGGRVLRLIDGRTRDDLDTDIALEGALIHALAMIGEAARSVPEDTRARYTEVAWRRWVGFRNILIHAYHRVDLDLVWDVSTEEVGPLVELVQGIIRQEFPQEGAQ